MESELVAESGASRTAVREALDTLTAQGLVTRVRGRGTRVTGRITVLPLEDLRGATDDPATGVTVDRREVRPVPCPPQVRDALGTDHETVGFVEDVFLVAGEPIGLRVAYHDPAGRQLPREGPAPTIARAFRETFGTELAEVTSAVEVVAADERTARILGVPVGSPLLAREQRLTDVEGRVREINYAQYRADRVSFETTA